MTLRRTASTLALVLTLLGTVLVAGPAPAGAPTGAPAASSAAPSAASSADRAAKRAVYWSLGAPVVKPKRIWQYYDSTPYAKGLRWKHWGQRVTIGRGVWISDCSACSPPARRKATIRLSGFVTCKQDRSVRSYRKAIITVSKPDEGSTTTQWELFAGCP